MEAYTGMRPVLVFGALADTVVASLLESYPNMFYTCNTGEWFVVLLRCPQLRGDLTEVSTLVQ